MKIISHYGNEISSLEDWAELYAKPSKRKDWKKGRSAYSVADFILSGGAVHLETRLSEVLKQSVSLRLINPEKEVRFDGYPGRGRVHDLAIEGIVGGEQSLFLGIEAKVDETFGPSLGDRFEGAKKELIRCPRSRAIDRIEALPARFSPRLTLSEMLDIRYQLVHGTAGTVSARQGNGEPYDLYVFYVLVFKTSLYDEQAGEQNYLDYLRFINRVGAVDLEHPGIEAHSIIVDDKPLTCIYEYVELPA